MDTIISFLKDLDLLEKRLLTGWNRLRRRCRSFRWMPGIRRLNRSMPYISL